MNLGNIEIADLRLGASQVKAVYLGNEQVWSGEEPIPVGDALCFTSLQNGSTLRLDKVGSPNAISLLTSDTGGATWKDYNWTGNTGDLFANLNVGDKVYIRAKNENQTIGSADYNYYLFVMTGLIAASGNILTLLKADGSRTDAPAYCYYSLFESCTSLTTAPSLPATTLANSCYSEMFNGCTSLTTAPSLPATTLATGCYRLMFRNCSSLTAVPSLPATTLANYCYLQMFQNCTSLSAAQTALSATALSSWCYTSMFNGCTSLTAAPSLPATTLADNCYSSMFSGCSSLTTAPALPATTLTTNCYYTMFYGCSSLSSIEVALTAWNPSAATTNWLSGVAANGTFTCPAELSDIRDASHIPVGWTKQEPTNIPLTFTATLANSTVRLKKDGSPGAISLETSTDGSTWTDYSWSGSTGTTLTLANVGDKVYMRAKNENQTIGSPNYNYYLFVMTGLIAASGNILTLLKADGSRTDAPAYCYSFIFWDCTSLTTAPKLPATTLAEGCYFNMFNGCRSLTTAPELPATTLAQRCYLSMFLGCTSLTVAPALPATTLVNNCYYYMFNSCTNLASIDVSFTTWGSTATDSWVYGVAASGTFTCPVELPDTRGASNIPVGWTRKEPADTPLTFIAEQAGSTVQLNKVGSPDAISLEYSTNGSSWSTYSWASGGVGDSITLTNVGDKVMFRASSENSTLGKTTDDCYQFIMSGQVAAYGNIQSLLKADGSRTDAPAYCYSGMFNGCSSLTKAPMLPATTLATYCYFNMFADCTSLTTAPAILPATTLATYCYNDMFYNCLSLKPAPELPATTLADYCYFDMFRGCTSLTSAPTLPATTLAKGCYSSMFADCISLESAPELPATTLANECYMSMFNDCPSLTSAPVLSATILAGACYDGMFLYCSSLSSMEVLFTTWQGLATSLWLDGVAASGTFTCPSTLPDVRDESHIPTDWTKADLT